MIQLHVMGMYKMASETTVTIALLLFWLGVCWNPDLCGINEQFKGIIAYVADSCGWLV